MKEYNYRHVARIVVEAKTPLAIGTGAKNILTDSPVAIDVNGLPYIPATSLAGVIKSAIDDDSIFGYQDENGGEGSMIVFTDAVMVGKEGRAIDGLCNIDWNDDFYRHYAYMPVRQHVRINKLGTTDKKSGKFDGQVVYKGTRFVFEMELISDSGYDQSLAGIIERLRLADFRIGGGTRKGYGKISIVGVQKAVVNLKDSDDLNAYLKKSSSLTHDWEKYSPYDGDINEEKASDWDLYSLTLKPLDFMLFGSGISDDDADNVTVSESVVEWNNANGTPQIVERRILIPASSLKGAIAHRTAYYYNKITGRFAKTTEDVKAYEDNFAVETLFGIAGQNSKEIKRGNVLFSDIFGESSREKVMHHVKIDYFTGGKINGALFQEKVAMVKGKSYKTDILVNRNIMEFEDANKVIEAFETALIDICEGLLPLGGATNRGYGIFDGELKKNGVRIYPKE